MTSRCDLSLCDVTGLLIYYLQQSIFEIVDMDTILAHSRLNHTKIH